MVQIRCCNLVSTNRNSVLPAGAVLLLCLTLYSGCSHVEGERADRVAIEVTVRIGDVPASNGSLVLRPDPGTKGPLVQIPISDGAGSLPQQKGPVPGRYTASWRSSEADLTNTLSADTKRHPSSVAALPQGLPQGAATASKATASKATAQSSGPQSTSISIPTTNPAVVTVQFGADG